MAVRQAKLNNKKIESFNEGLGWWREKDPDGYEAYLYLAKARDLLPQGARAKNIVEADSDSFADGSQFSIFLGWPTIVGWYGHEWTWRGSYDEIGKRREAVRKIYTAGDPAETGKILKDYKIDYIIVAANERARFGPNLKERVLRGMGDVVFEKGKTFIVRLSE